MSDGRLCDTHGTAGALPLVRHTSTCPPGARAFLSLQASPCGGGTSYCHLLTDLGGNEVLKSACMGSGAHWCWTAPSAVWSNPEGPSNLFLLVKVFPALPFSYPVPGVQEPHCCAGSPRVGHSCFVSPLVPLDPPAVHVAVISVGLY